MICSLAVHAGSGVNAGLIEGLRRLRPDLPTLELVHRLDRATSGCLLIAKRRTALLGLHGMLREGSIEKRYLALVKGRWRGGAREINVPLARDRIRSGERLVSVSREGRAARSRFAPRGVFGPAMLMDVTAIRLPGTTNTAIGNSTAICEVLDCGACSCTRHNCDSRTRNPALESR